MVFTAHGQPAGIGLAVSAAEAGLTVRFDDFLARPAADIYLNEIIKVLDEDVLSAHCESYTGVRDACVHHGDCGIRPVIIGLHEIVENALSKITLAQLVGTETSVDAMFHQIQGIHRTIEPQRV